jgi:hypothetical protein
MILFSEVISREWQSLDRKKLCLRADLKGNANVSGVAGRGACLLIVFMIAAGKQSFANGIT